MQKMNPEHNKGFARTPTLALLQSFFSETLVKNKIIETFKFFSNINKQQKTMPKLVCGFALVETIVSVAIFSVIMTVGIVSLLSVINVNERAQSFKIVVNNLNLAIESMSKEIRVGYDYCASGANCNGNADSMSFVSKDGDDITYRLQDSSIQRSINTGAFQDLTADDVVIDKLQFYVVGSRLGGADLYQPYVIILIEGHSGAGAKKRIDFDLQTTVTQRKLDF